MPRGEGRHRLEPADSPGGRPPEIRALTGLRFVAAALVVLHHIGLPHRAPEPLQALVARGFVGVPLFFMLSGVVLAYNYPEMSPRSGRGLTRFYVARLARIMPLYWTVLAFVVVVRMTHNYPERGLLQHVAGLQAWSADYRTVVGYNAPAWSVSVELLLYAVFPLLVPLVARVARQGMRPLALLAAGCAALDVAAGAAFRLTGRADLLNTDPDSANRWLYHHPVPRIPEFVIGLAIAFALHRGLRVRPAVATALQVGAVTWITALLATPAVATPLRGFLYGAAFLVPFAVLITTLAAAPDAPLSRLLAAPTVVGLGAASYALYLTHWPLITQIDAREAVSNGDGREVWVAIVLYFGMAVALAEGVHRYVEVPARRRLLALSGRRDVEAARRTGVVTSPSPAPSVEGASVGRSPVRVPVVSSVPRLPAGPQPPAAPAGNGSNGRAASVERRPPGRHEGIGGLRSSGRL